jgi:hypothetical protein
MQTAHLCRVNIADQRRPYATVPVCGYAHADTGAAYQDGPFAGSVRYFFCDFMSEVRVVHRIGGVRTEVFHINPFIREEFEDYLFCAVAAMVTCDGDCLFVGDGLPPGKNYCVR